MEDVRARAVLCFACFAESRFTKLSCILVSHQRSMQNMDSPNGPTHRPLLSVTSSRTESFSTSSDGMDPDGALNMVMM